MKRWIDILIICILLMILNVGCSLLEKPEEIYETYNGGYITESEADFWLQSTNLEPKDIIVYRDENNKIISIEDPNWNPDK